MTKDFNGPEGQAENRPGVGVCSFEEVSPLEVDVVRGPGKSPLVGQADLEDGTIAACFERAAERYPERLAVDDGRVQLTYEQLRRQVRSLAARIEAVPVSNKPVGLFLSKTAALPVAALACLATGRCYMPIDPHLPRQRIDDMLAATGVDTLIAEESSGLAGRVPNLVEVRIGGPIDLEGAAPSHRRRRADEPAVILYTSGSTGKPKAICNTEASILQRVVEYSLFCTITHDDRFILLSTPGTITTAREMFTALLNGAALYLADPKRDGLKSVLATFARGQITVAYAVPSLMRVLFGLPEAATALTSFCILRMGGDAWLASDLTLFNKVTGPQARMLNTFGSTESPCAMMWLIPRDWTPDTVRLPVGRPAPGIRFEVLDEDGTRVLDGEPGELVVHSPYLALGYWTERGVNPGPFTSSADDPSVRVYRTGDVVRRRDDGLWEPVGRKDWLIKLNGMRVDTSEVEAALRACPGVADAAVLGRAPQGEVTGLVAFVVLDAKHAAADAAGVVRDVNDRLAAVLPEYMRPGKIHLLEALPVLPNYKVDRAALRRLDAESSPSLTAYVPPGEIRAEVDDDAAEAVRHAWSTIIGAAYYDADAPWEATGADSLAALQMFFLIEQRLKFLPPMDLLDGNTTPRRLAAAIRQRTSDTAGRAKGGSASPGATPVVFLMPGVLGDDPLMSEFRAAVTPEIRFRVVEYPDWSQTFASGVNLETIVEAALDRVLAEPGIETYRLAGYSFGGAIAFEVAQRLAEKGRTVSFVGLIDTRRWDIIEPQQNRTFRKLVGESNSWKTAVVRAVIIRFVRNRWWAMLDRMKDLADRRSSQWSFVFARRLMMEVRRRAMLEWRPRRTSVPTTLFLSDSRWPGEPADYGWGELCDDLRTVHVGGNHASMLRPPLRDRVCEEFRAAAKADGPVRAGGVGAAKSQPTS